MFSICYGANNDFFNPGKKQELQEDVQNNRTSHSIKSNHIFASYEDKIPKNAYVKQLIPLQIRITTTEDFNFIRINSSNKEIGIIHDLSPVWEKIDTNTYTKTIYFQAKKPTDTLPELIVTFEGKSEIQEIAYLPFQKISIISINDDEGKFIDIFAQDLQINKFKTSRFNEDSLIMVLEINILGANSNDIYFQNIQKQGTDSKSGVFPNETLFYFLIFPDTLQSIEFSYFNLTKNGFEHIKLPIVIGEEDLSTQIGLNPKKSVFEFYKEITIAILAALFFLLFLFRRKYIFLIIALLLTGYFTYKKVSFVDIKLKNNTKVRILPTEKSTIFFTTDSSIEVEKLNQIKSYIKVLLPNGKIGWVKESDIVKD